MVIETNGDFSFLGDGEKLLISNIIQSARSQVKLCEFQGQNIGAVESRILDSNELPINPIYYENNIDDDITKISLKYFVKCQEELKKQFKDRPYFAHDFDCLFESQTTQSPSPTKRSHSNEIQKSTSLKRNKTD